MVTFFPSIFVFEESTAQSTIIYLNNTTVTKATLTATEEGLNVNAGVNYFLSADDGVTFESVTNGIEHTFTVTGTKLKWKAVLFRNDGSSNPKVTELQVSYVAV